MVTNDCMSLSIKKINRAESYKWKFEIETLTYTSMIFFSNPDKWIQKHGVVHFFQANNGKTY